MIKIILRIISDFKDYFLLIILVLISLFILSRNNHSAAKHLRTYSIGAYAILSEAGSAIISIFKHDDSVDELRKRNAELMLYVNQLRKNGIENIDLKKRIDYLDTTRVILIPAKIISKMVNKVDGTYIINRGKDEGLVKGMPVLTEEGLIGLIDLVDSDYSTLRNLYNSTLNIAVTLQRLNVDGILSYNGNNLIIKNIPTTYDIKIGDIVETSVLSTSFPPHIPVGVVLKKEKNVLGLLHTLTIKTNADIFAASNVFVLPQVPSTQINNLEMNLVK